MRRGDRFATEDRDGDGATWTPQAYRKNKMSLFVVGAMVFTTLAAVFAFMLSPFAALGAAAGAFLASRVLARHDPPPFGINRQQFAVPAYFFTDAYQPLRERLKANVDPIRSPLFVALVVAAVWIGGWWFRGGAPGFLERGLRERASFPWSLMPPRLYMIFGEVFFACVTGFFAHLAAVGWSWFGALRRTPFVPAVGPVSRE